MFSGYMCIFPLLYKGERDFSFPYLAGKGAESSGAVGFSLFSVYKPHGAKVYKDGDL